MVHRRIHIGVETVFVRGVEVPRRRRLVCDQLYFHNGFDALEAVFPRRDEADGCAVLRWQRTAINSAGKQSERVHRLVHPQALDVRPLQHVGVLARHAFGVEQRFKGNVLGVAGWLDLRE